MIKYIDWGKHIRLGNWLFLYAGINSMIKKSGSVIAFPNYFLWDYLEKRPNITTDTNYNELFHFRQTNYTHEERDWIENYFVENKDKIININLGSHLQSERWWKEDEEYVKSILKIKQEKIDAIKEKYKYIFENGKGTIAISIRRGDFVNHGCFYQIPETWYLKALQEEFGYGEFNVLIFSDDIEWCKNYYKGKNFFFAEPNNTHLHTNGFKYYHKDPMEQFILGTLCNHCIIGSSTFSWWMGKYIEWNGGKVVHCGENLKGDCLKKFYNPDYYPKSWTLSKI